jgi:Fe-S cluster assembly protein SufB
MANKSDDILEEYSSKEYEFGFVTDIEMEVAPRGLSEETVHYISAKKQEPQWLLDWRLKGYHSFLKAEDPHWQNFELPKVDFQGISYYAAPKSRAKYKSIDEVDP